jgi:hypothetical protein
VWVSRFLIKWYLILEILISSLSFEIKKQKYIDRWINYFRPIYCYKQEFIQIASLIYFCVCEFSFAVLAAFKYKINFFLLLLLLISSIIWNVYLMINVSTNTYIFQCDDLTHKWSEFACSSHLNNYSERERERKWW